MPQARLNTEAEKIPELLDREERSGRDQARCGAIGSLRQWSGPARLAMQKQTFVPAARVAQVRIPQMVFTQPQRLIVSLFNAAKPGTRKIKGRRSGATDPHHGRVLNFRRKSITRISSVELATLCAGMATDNRRVRSSRVDTSILFLSSSRA